MLVSVVHLSDLVMCDKSLQLSLTLFDPMDCSLPGCLCSWGFSRQGYWRGFPFPSPGDISNPGIKPRSPALQADSLLSEPPGKPKNTGVGSLAHLQGTFPTQALNWVSHLQGIFPTQALNWGFLHPYQVSYQGSPCQIRITCLIFFQCVACLDWSDHVFLLF